MKLFAVCLAASAAAPTNSDILDWGNVSWNVRHTKNDIALKLSFLLDSGYREAVN